MTARRVKSIKKRGRVSVEKARDYIRDHAPESRSSFGVKRKSANRHTAKRASSRKSASKASSRNVNRGQFVIRPDETATGRGLVAFRIEGVHSSDRSGRLTNDARREARTR